VVSFPLATLVDLRNQDHSLEGEIQDQEYSLEDDAAIEKFVRGHVETTWHSLGTCAMRPREDNGVVDKDLNVYGIQGLKVASKPSSPQP
jgi:alcohol oxidase